MTGNHWTDDDLLDRLYTGGDSTHLDECELCRARWHRLVEKRNVLLAAEERVPAGLLRAQRVAVHAAIGADAEPPRVGLRALVASAAATAAIAGLLLYVPGTRSITGPPTQHAAVTDKQLFAEISSELEDPAPRAVAPIRALFNEEERQQ